MPGDRQEKTEAYEDDTAFTLSKEMKEDLK